MFLFRKNAQQADDAGDHEPINVTNAAYETEAAAAEDKAMVDAYGHDEDEEETQYAEAVEEGEERSEEEKEGVEAYQPEENESNGEEEALHDTREGTVPPLEEHHIVQQHQSEVEAEGAAEASAAVPSHASPAAPASELTMPRIHAAAVMGSAAATGATEGSAHHQHSSNYTPHMSINLNNATGNNVHRNSRGTTPRAASSLSPRSHSRGGHSYAGSALSAEEIEVREQQYRRASSVVFSARNLMERRASSVNYLVGNIDGGADVARRRAKSMTVGEREAVERLMEHEIHRQEAAERSAQFGRIRETTLVEMELAKQKASYELLLEKKRERQAEIGRRSSLREQRMATATQRRQELEEKRQQAVLSSVGAKDMRYTMRDPYTVVAAQRRYRSPIAPSRRVSSPVQQTNNGDSSNSRGSGAGAVCNGNGGGSRAHSASANYRGDSASAEEVRRIKPGIDTSRPKKCLPLSAWKTPEQLQRKERAGTYSPRCLSPAAWRAPTVVDHPRQWH